MKINLLKNGKIPEKKIDEIKKEITKFQNEIDKNEKAKVKDKQNEISEKIKDIFPQKIRSTNMFVLETINEKLKKIKTINIKNQNKLITLI